ncbi:MAG: rod shape-determining protein RodA [Anaerolineales bacterium]|nr:rod shape-determining protein RodA [Anaerolineales bacterium]MCZ2120924.1 rod shape-determining protein RodA [Anaerolineales bacterium]
MSRPLSWRNFDFLLLGAVVLASAFGIAMIRSAIAGNEELITYPTRQTYFLIVGVVVIFLLAGIDYRYWLSIHWLIYFVMMGFLISLSGLGQAAFGAQRWFQVGVLFLQPTEFAKIVIILILARYFEKSQFQPRDLKWLGFSLAWTWGLLIWILLQPNLSNVIVTMVIWFFMVWMNRIELKTLFWMGVSGLAGGALAFPFLADYQKQRVINFLFPDPNASYGAIYNVQQALIAIGSGGLFGKGFGHGTQTQLRFMKVRHTDFIFSVISEEFGLIGAILVIATVGFVVWRCIRAAQKSRDVSGSMIALGVATLLFFQGAANLAMNMNLIPVSGLPLPFFSYGGSGLMSLMVCVGLVESVAMRHKSMDF